MLSKTGEIRRDEACLDYSGGDVVLYPCHGSKGNQVISILIIAVNQHTKILKLSFQYWVYNTDTNQLRHGSSDKCLSMTENKKKIVMEECSKHKEPQKWKLQNYDASKL